MGVDAVSDASRTSGDRQVRRNEEKKVENKREEDNRAEKTQEQNRAEKGGSITAVA